MKKTISIVSIILLITSLLVFTGCSTSSEETPWLTSWADAIQKADETEKNILIFFSRVGSDEKSQEINEAFAKPKFKNKIAKNYVLLNIDFLANPDEMEYDDLMAAYELANKFSIQALPAIILATPEAYVIGSVVNDEINQSPSAIFKKINSYKKNSTNVTKLRKELAEVEEDKQIYTVDKLISNLDPSYRYLELDLLGLIKEKDPENELGIYNKYLLSFAYVDALGEFNKGNAQSAIDIFLKVAESEGISKADCQEAYQTAAYLLANTGIGTPEVIIEYLQKAIDANPNSKEVSSIKKTIEYLNEMMAQGPQQAPSTGGAK
ncbi:MAG: thioredoxin family protein [Treponemataceae bacterium]|nr:thioredoxin family protein [Treponemataceae bacterium]